MNSNNYDKQNERALKRKMELIEYKGGKCEKCGYDKNLSALEFHHINPSEKEFQIDSRHISNTSIVRLKKEINKCMLLCSNCHKEIHYPKYDKSNLDDLLETYKTNNIKILEDKKIKQSICPVCGSVFPYSSGKIFCSVECRNKNKNYPTFETLQQEYSVLGSWEKVAQKFGITRKIIQNIRKRNNS